MKKCSNCNKKNVVEAKFCVKCGIKLTKAENNKESEIKQTRPEYNRITNRLVILSSIISLVILFLIIFPTSTYFYEIEVPYETTETYIEKEPYQVQEPFEKQVAYQTTETYTDTVPIQSDVAYEDCLVGDWWCETKYRIEVTKQEIQKERPVTKYQTVTDYHTITKYRDVTKTRTVMKIKKETRSKETHWLLDLDMPWKLHIIYLSK